MDETTYQALYQYSIEQPDEFWAEQAQRFVTWFNPWSTVRQGDFQDLDIKWFDGGQLNASYNCLDRHLETKGNQTALIWEGNEPSETRSYTFIELHRLVCQFANVLKGQGIQKGFRVSIYLPMIPEAVIAMLACARIGAIHSVVFAGFSSDSLRDRILDADSQLLITADDGLRGEKPVPLKEKADEALLACPEVKSMIIVQRSNRAIPWKAGRDIWYHEAMQTASPHCPVEVMDAQDPLFILYTSGSTGSPKGVLHVTGGYLVYAAMTHQYVFNANDKDVYWCTADVGWITGHTYAVYAPLANGITTLLYEGVPQYPTYSRFWEIIDKHQVSIFYTAPTVIRALRREGDNWVTASSRQSLRLLGTVGEPINPEVWTWYFNVIGERRCPIVDTWWQTETGGILLAPIPGVLPMVPGSVGQPFFGIQLEVVSPDGRPVAPGAHGSLVVKQPWPGLMQSIYRNKARFVDTYFKAYPGCYLTGDGAYCNGGQYYTITGRNDDVINVSGHRLGTGELESILLKHPSVSEAAVVGVPHEITGEALYAFVTVKLGAQKTDALKMELVQHVRQHIGAIAKIETIQWADGLPKTRSGKIMRRILRKIASNQTEELGDISTLAEPGVVEQLIAGHAQQ
jgi:acetyl-CoA synthetase